jgi:magnesium-transporting ATPase (P-type)
MIHAHIHDTHICTHTRQEWAEVGLICGVVVINVTIGLVQEGKAQAAADAIKNMLSPSAQVVRDGNAESVQSVRVRIRIKPCIYECFFKLESKAFFPSHPS